MLFNSLAFVVLVCATLCVYYLPWCRRAQTYILIAASVVFYAYGQPALVLLLLFSILINATASFKVLSASIPSARRRWAVAGVAVNLLVLFLFKYGPLAVRTARLDTSDAGSLAALVVALPLPIGISFFTFQGISLVVDVFRQRPTDSRRIVHHGVWRHFVDTAVFKSFFPQLVAGPIVKAHDFYPQIGPKRLREVPWERAFRALVIGYFLKMVVADNLKDLTFWLTYPYFLNFSTLTLLSLLFGYSMQIFADFAGYSLIAIGTARLFGYELMENFNFPYISQSLSEFWRRWHISLSTWLREYLYIPLGGNRHGPLRTYFNLMLVMLLGGLWHGAAWSYAIWGALHGVGLAVERAFQREGARHATPRGFSVLRMLAVFAFVTAAWLLFRLPNFAHVVAFVRACWLNTQRPDHATLLAFILLYSVPVVAWHYLHVVRQHRPAMLQRWQPALLGACVFSLLVNSGSSGAFIYFQF